MATKISYNTFKKEVFNKIREKQKNKLFYWSLFDHSTWEEIDQPHCLPKFSVGKREVFSILQISPSIKKLVKLDKDGFYKDFVESETLTNYLLSAQIEQKMKKGLKGNIDIPNLEKRVFPDIIIKETRLGRINIEIKRLVSAKNLFDRVKIEVIAKIRQYKRWYNRFLLIILFPSCQGDNPDRVNELIAGYYVYEELMSQKNTKRNVLCACINSTGNKHTLNKLVERILNYIKNNKKR